MNILFSVVFDTVIVLYTYTLYINVVVAVIPKVLAHVHSLLDVPVTVEPYYKWLHGAAAGVTETRLPRDNCLDSVTVTCQPEALDFIIHNPAVKTEIEARLERDSCVVSWPQSPGDVVELKFKKTSDQKCPPPDWTDKCKSVMDKLMSDIKCDTANILQEIWNSFKMQVNERMKRDSFMIRFEFDDDHCNLHFVGKKDACEKFSAVVQSIKTRLEEELRKKHEQITETIANLAAHQLMILSLCNYADEVAATVKDVQVVVTKNEVHMTGMTDDVKSAKLKVFEKVSQLQSSLITISKVQAELMEKESVTSHLLECFRHGQVVASWRICDTQLSVFAFSTDQLTVAKEIIQSEFVEKEFALDASSKSLMSQQKWTEFKKQLISEHKMVVIDESKDGLLVLCCIRECRYVTQEKIQDFIAKNSLVQKLVSLMRPLVDFLEQYMPSDLDQIRLKLTQCGGYLKRASSDSEPGFVLLGSQAAVELARSQLIKLTDTVAIYDHDIDRPGVPGYLMSTPGTAILSELQRRHEAVIDVENVGTSTENAAAAANDAGVVKYSRKV